MRSWGCSLLGCAVLCIPSQSAAVLLHTHRHTHISSGQRVALHQRWGGGGACISTHTCSLFLLAPFFPIRAMWNTLAKSFGA